MTILTQGRATYEATAQNGATIALDSWVEAMPLRSMHEADAAYLTGAYGAEVLPEFVTDLPTHKGAQVWMNVKVTGRTIQRVIGGMDSVRVQVTFVDDPGTLLADGTKLDAHGEVVSSEPRTAGGWMSLAYGKNLIEKF